MCKKAVNEINRTGLEGSEVGGVAAVSEEGFLGTTVSEESLERGSQLPDVMVNVVNLAGSRMA